VTATNVQHTPGPWNMFTEDDEGPGKLPGTYTVDGPSLDWIAQGINDEANARLIAAAPDLLAALERLIDSPPLSDYVTPEIDAALVAITKARGEAAR
jgi:hypothetical protein